MGHGGYARGYNALGHCGRCGKKMLLRQMIYDGQVSDLLVCNDCWDPKHPQEYLPDVSDPVTLFDPTGDMDNQSNKLVITLDQLTTNRQRSVGEESSIPVQAFPIGQNPSSDYDTVSYNPLKVDVKVGASIYQLKAGQDPADGPQIAPPLEWPALATDWTFGELWEESAGDLTYIDTTMGGTVRANGISWSPDGEYMMLSGTGTNRYYSFRCATPFDPSTAYSNTQGVFTNPMHGKFIPNTDYWGFVTVSSFPDKVMIYDQLSTTRYEVSSDDIFVGQITKTTAFETTSSRDGSWFMSADGQYLYYSGASTVYGSSLRNFKLSTPYDPSSYEAIPHSEANVAGIISVMNVTADFQVHPNGQEMFIAYAGRWLWKATMSTPHDLSTLSIDTVNVLHVPDLTGVYGITGYNWNGFEIDSVGQNMFWIYESSSGTGAILRLAAP